MNRLFEMAAMACIPLALAMILFPQFEREILIVGFSAATLAGAVTGIIECRKEGQ